MALALSLALLSACQLLSTPPMPAQPAVGFDRDESEPLPPIDDSAWMAAWPAWLASCRVLASASHRHQAAWQPVCVQAQRLQPQNGAQVREFFSQKMDRYRVLALEPGAAAAAAWGARGGASVRERTTGLVTGYYEPLIEGSRQRADPFVVPVYRAPPVPPRAPRSQLLASGQLRGQELLWVRDPIEAYLLEVQGSGRIHLADGSLVRLAYAATNGQAYRSIGRWLVEQGELDPHGASLQAIVDWAHAHPQRVRELLDQNPRMVFFRELALGEPDAGPVGTLGVALTAGISVAVDPRCLPLGAPLIVQTTAPANGEALARVVLAQDTGGAIQGALRIDWFWGLGSAAAQVAGRQHAQGTVHLLVPHGVAPASLL